MTYLMFSYLSQKFKKLAWTSQSGNAELSLLSKERELPNRRQEEKAKLVEKQSAQAEE